VDRPNVPRRRIFAAAAAVGTLVGAWLSLRQLRQSELDRELLASIRGRDTPSAIALLNEGADANATQWIGRPVSPFDWIGAAATARMLGRPVLYRFGYQAPALYLAYAGRYPSPNPSLIKALLDHGADPNYFVGRPGPLATAVRLGDVESVRLLLEHHADPNTPGLSDMLPLMSADAACTRLLIAHGARVNARSYSGLTPLMAAAADRGPSAVERARLLLDMGADPNARDRYGQTALMHAMEPAVVQLLAARGAIIDARSGTGMTALMMDCLNYSNPAVPRLLVRLGADISLRDNAGRTALDYARQQRRADLCSLLERAAKPGQPKGTHKR
jgi:uncharacterized protein